MPNDQIIYTITTEDNCEIEFTDWSYFSKDSEELVITSIDHKEDRGSVEVSLSKEEALKLSKAITNMYK